MNELINDRIVDALSKIEPQRLTSMEADFDTMEWKFHAPDFRCGAGAYVVIREDQWNDFTTRLMNAAMGRTE